MEGLKGSVARFRVARQPGRRNGTSGREDGEHEPTNATPSRLQLADGPDHIRADPPAQPNRAASDATNPGNSADRSRDPGHQAPSTSPVGGPVGFRPTRRVRVPCGMRTSHAPHPPKRRGAGQEAAWKVRWHDQPSPCPSHHSSPGTLKLASPKNPPAKPSLSHPPASPGPRTHPAHGTKEPRSPPEQEPAQCHPHPAWHRYRACP
jgi:hypothetical protein